MYWPIFLGHFFCERNTYFLSVSMRFFIKSCLQLLCEIINVKLRSKIDFVEIQRVNWLPLINFINLYFSSYLCSIKKCIFFIDTNKKPSSLPSPSSSTVSLATTSTIDEHGSPTTTPTTHHQFYYHDPITAAMGSNHNGSTAAVLPVEVATGNVWHPSPVSNVPPAPNVR